MRNDTKAALNELVGTLAESMKLAASAVVLDDMSDVIRLRNELAVLWNAIDNFEAHAERDHPGTGTIPGPEEEHASEEVAF